MAMTAECVARSVFIHISRHLASTRHNRVLPTLFCISQRAGRKALTPPTRTPFSTTARQQFAFTELPAKTSSEWTAVTTALSDFFLALPEQTGLSYTGAVIATTILLRAAVHVPVTLWARARAMRYQTLVIPARQRFMAQLYRRRVSRAEVQRWSKEKVAAYTHSMTKKVEDEEQRLARYYNCYYPHTMIGAIAIPIPLLFLVSSALRTACAESTPTSPLTPFMAASDSTALETLPALFAETSLFSDRSIVFEDPTLAVVFGASLLLGSEVSWSLRKGRDWLRGVRETPQQVQAGSEVPSSGNARPQSTAGTSSISGTVPSSRREGVSKMEGLTTAQRRSQGFFSPEGLRTFSGAMAIVFAGVGMYQPALVLIYWTTNTLCAIAQNVFFNRRDRLRLAELQAATASFERKTAPTQSPSSARNTKR